MNTQTISIFLALLIVGIGIAYAILTSPSNKSTWRKNLTPYIEIASWASSLGLTFEAPRKNPRYPVGSLAGIVQGYDVRVSEGTSPDADGYVDKRFLVVEIVGKNKGRWPYAHSSGEIKKLITKRPDLKPFIDSIKYDELFVLLGKVHCILILPDSKEPPFSLERVRQTLQGGVELAQRLDM